MKAFSGIDTDLDSAAGFWMLHNFLQTKAVIRR